MSEQEGNYANDSSGRLNIMAAAVEHMSTSLAASGGSAVPSASSPPRRSKLVLPSLTPAMQQDLALSKGSAGKGSRPLSISARPEFADYQLQGIVTPHPHDVLCGRGGGSNNHPGNESFRELVNEVKFPYVNCPKREKPLIARRIVEAVRNQTPPGRFLSKDATRGVWNDIGDGKAREKTSQALREGAPIIRDMMGKPTSPTNVAAVLKEAKKAERAEKEYGVRLPRRSQDKGDGTSSSAAADMRQVRHDADIQPSTSLPSMEPALKRAKSVGGSPTVILSNSGASPAMPHVKKLRPFRDMDASGTSSAQVLPTWHIQQPGRGFGIIPYAAATHHSGQMMGGFGSHSKGRTDFAASMPARYPPPDSVPVDTVRRLLLGQLDPVQLALQILPPEEAAAVSRMHTATGLPRMIGGGRLPPPAPGPSLAVPSHPLPLAPVVSDGSSSSSSSAGEARPRRTTPESADAPARSAGSCDESSSVDSTSKQSNNSCERRALPKKKRKYVEESG